MSIQQVKRAFAGNILLFFVFLFVGRLPAQLLNIDSCLRVLKTMPDDTNKVLLLNDIAWDISYQNLQQGIDYAEQGLALANKLGTERYHSRLLHTMGAIYMDMSEQGKALNLFLESLKYTKKYNQQEFVGFLYNSFGNFYSRQGDDRKAVSYYLQAVAAHKKAGRESPLSSPYNNLGAVYMNLNMADSAEYYLDLCTAYNKETNNRLGLVNNYVTLSEIYSATHRNEKSLEYAVKSVNLVRQLNEKYLAGRSLMQLGKLLYHNKRHKEAGDIFMECLELAGETGDLDIRKEAALYLSRIYDDAGDYKRALDYFKQHKNYADSLLNGGNIRQIRAAEAKYENEKKQAEIDLLAEKQKLSEAKREKDKLYLYVAIAGIVGLAGLIVLLFRNNRSKQKTNRELAAYNQEVKYQKDLVEGKNKEITDSINYAQRIQQSILTNHSYFEKHTRDFFILFQPKDIVSGDFYWALKHDKRLMVMTADCTGHGVPGAMMSMMGVNFLNEIVSEKKITSPAAVLNQLRKEIIKALNPEGSLVEAKDGMDCSLCSFDMDTLTLRYANANNRFYVLRKGQLIVSQVNKMPVGAGHNSETPFTEFELGLQKDDLVITFTDGYADQFGGPKGKKFKYRQLEELLVAHAHQPLNVLQSKLEESIKAWKGNLEQVDDICIVGIKV